MHRAPSIALGVSATARHDHLLPPKDAAAYLGLTERQLQQLRRRGDGPCFVKIGHKTVRYSVTGLRKWIETRTVANTSEARELREVADE